MRRTIYTSRIRHAYIALCECHEELMRLKLDNTKLGKKVLRTIKAFETAHKKGTVGVK